MNQCQKYKFVLLILRNYIKLYKHIKYEKKKEENY